MKISETVKHAVFSRSGWVCAGGLAQAIGCDSHTLQRQLQQWEREGRLFSVVDQGRRWYPEYAFNAAVEPLPSLAPIVRSLKRIDVPAWSMATWFATQNRRLNGECPLLLLESDPTSVVRAAQHDFALKKVRRKSRVSA